MGVIGRVDDEVVVDGDVSVGLVEYQVIVQVFRRLPDVFPAHFSRNGIACLDDVARIRQEHHAVMDQGCTFLDRHAVDDTFM